MRQRVALLRTYLCNKEVALLDEPFSALDTITRASMQQWYLDMMKDIKLSSLFITHDMDEAILLSDRIYIMKGSPATIVEEIVVDEERPRTVDFTFTEKFLGYKKRIRELL
jgi:ABC-type nitrate/sulfonate/bicarbonate transport system ATPase subunit